MLKELRFKRQWLTFLALAVILLVTACQQKALQPGVKSVPGPNVLAAFSFVVSMDEPASNRFKVEFRYEGVPDEEVELKMPAWSPGYYRIMNFAKNVDNFRASDEGGRALAWDKTNENTWRVKLSGAHNLVATYEVVAQGQSVAESQLTEKRAYISPTSVFMFVSGKLDYPVRVTIKPYSGFSHISTGLEPVIGQENTFYAESFDLLYDCPLYVGNQEIINFEVSGIPYELAVDEAREFNRTEIVSALKRLIVAATGIIGEIPYRRYVFIMMGPGRGGLEHRNSMAIFTELPRLEDRRDFQSWLSFIAHEFFHLYNVKAIRPVALGPFDYEKANRTKMLWFSEGGTVYYEYLILRRAGFMTRDEFLRVMSQIIGKVENSAARKLESAAQASYNAWEEPFFGSQTTISYYDLGAILTMLLDLKIRQETDGQKNLDEVMRLLYQRFYQQQRRGFTDEEFRAVCQEVTGVDLSEFFNYVYTTESIDYNKYLGSAGLKLEVKEGEGGRRNYYLRMQGELDGRQLRLLTSWL
ncbi:MAG: M61 family metallopeptidase [Candidatus Saccharicenans sp.]